MLEVYNLLGQKITEEPLNKGTTEAILNLSSISTGSYLLKIREGINCITRKVIKD